MLSFLGRIRRTRSEKQKSSIIESKSIPFCGSIVGDADQQQLLAHRDFRLLYVPKDAVNGTMSIIRPRTNLYHRRRIMQRSTGELAFFALSHLWDTAAHDHMWDVGCFIQENSRPVKPIPMRPEKRETLLSLLRSHPDSYWWIDVLCARMDTPLVIMRDIYWHCNSCVILLDCDPSVIETLSGPCVERMWDALNGIRDAYSLGHSEARTQSLEFAQSYRKELEALAQLAACRWWSRVWTWQEAALPGWGSILAEQSDKHAVDLFDLKEISHLIYDMAHSFGEACDLVPLLQDTPQLRKMWHELGSPNGARKVRTVQSTDDLGSEGCFPIELLASFSKSSRTCMEPVDYVYGVLGFLQMDIPRMEDPRAVWSYFLAELERRITKTYGIHQLGEHIIKIPESARTFDLTTAKSMADVYGDLLHVEYRT